jgi:putative transposase
MERLSRLEQIFRENPVYFVTTCTHLKRELLANRDLHHAFVEFCRKSRDHEIHVGKYVLMPDHVHLMVCIAGSNGLSRWMKSLKNTLSKQLRLSGIESPHWQKGFFDHLIRSDESHAEKWKYVADNPVRRGLCERAEDWPYAGEISKIM